jgi:hypothetical protein
MVWEQNSRVIVMLTRLIEKGCVSIKRKANNNSKRNRSLTVVRNQFDPRKDYACRSAVLRKKTGMSISCDYNHIFSFRTNVGFIILTMKMKVNYYTMKLI